MDRLGQYVRISRAKREAFHLYLYSIAYRAWRVRRVADGLHRPIQACELHSTEVPQCIPVQRVSREPTLRPGRLGRQRMNAESGARVLWAAQRSACWRGYGWRGRVGPTLPSIVRSR